MLCNRERVRKIKWWDEKWGTQHFLRWKGDERISGFESS
jgi:hypothetical protein